MFFKIYLSKIYTLLYALEPIVEALLSLSLRYLLNMLSKRFNRFFRRQKTLSSHFIFYVREFLFIRCQVRTIRRMTHPIDVLSARKCSCLSRCVGARIVVVKSENEVRVREENPSSAVGFLDRQLANK